MRFPLTLPSLALLLFSGAAFAGELPRVSAAANHSFPASKSAQLLNEARSLGLALKMYANEHNGSYPQGKTTGEIIAKLRADTPRLKITEKWAYISGLEDTFNGRDILLFSAPDHPNGTYSKTRIEELGGKIIVVRMDGSTLVENFNVERGASFSLPLSFLNPIKGSLVLP